MEIKNILKKPYTGLQKNDFIVENNHKMGYEIRETEEALEAWGLDDNELLINAKQEKYNEALTGAKAYLESGDAVYEFEEGKHIEAFDGNISKMTAYLFAFESGIYSPDDTVIWVTKEDETVNLTKEQIAQILIGIGDVQAYVWSKQFTEYKAAIDEAQTIEEVEEIVIDYRELNKKEKERGE